MYIRQTNSTSSLLREQYSDALPNLYTIRTDYQSAGRGQAGNSWESEAGKNLLFSSLLRCSVSASEQFYLTMLVSVAMVDMLAQYLPQEGLRIKWPNDIYYGDRKLSGILVENTLIGGRVTYSIVGIGLNVNQQVFHSKAPNPVSMQQITGQEYDVQMLLEDYLKVLERRMNVPLYVLKAAYMGQLYRRVGWYPYVEREVSVAPTVIAHTDDPLVHPFLAEFVSITPNGELVLRTQRGDIKTYHFKQIRYIIDL